MRGKRGRVLRWRCLGAFLAGSASAVLAAPSEPSVTGSCPALSAAQITAIGPARDRLTTAVEQLKDEKLRGSAAADLFLIRAALDTGCLGVAQQKAGSLWRQARGKEADAASLWDAAVDMEASIAVAQRDFDGAETIWLQAADVVRASGGEAFPQKWGELIFRAATQRTFEGRQQRRLASFLRAAEIYRDRMLPQISKSTAPMEWTNAHANIALAQFEAAFLTSGVQRDGLLKASLGAVEEAISGTSREVNPEFWAIQQRRLAATLLEFARQGDSNAATNYRRAIEASRNALEILTQAGQPSEWAGAKLALGTALTGLADKSGGPQAEGLLAEAGPALRDGQTFFSRDGNLSVWMTSQSTLGLVALTRANRATGAAKDPLLAEAVAAFEACVGATGAKAFAMQWSNCEANRGWALLLSAERAAAPARLALLDQAEKVHRSALTVLTMQNDPATWANVQNNLGLILLRQSSMQKSAAALPLLQAALATFNEALKVYSREGMPQRWAQITGNASMVLSSLSVVDPPRAKGYMDRAVQGMTASVAVFTELKTPEVAQANAMLADMRAFRDKIARMAR